MHDEAAHDQWLAKSVQNWLLAVLRFAVTLDVADKQTILAMARDMDRFGSWPDQSPFTFFIRTSTELCNAIAISEDPGRTAILKRHLKMIEDRHLRHVMAAAVGLDNSLRACAQPR